VGQPFPGSPPHPSRMAGQICRAGLDASPSRHNVDSLWLLHRAKPTQAPGMAAGPFSLARGLPRLASCTPTSKRSWLPGRGQDFPQVSSGSRARRTALTKLRAGTAPGEPCSLTTAQPRSSHPYAADPALLLGAKPST